MALKTKLAAATAVAAAFSLLAAPAEAVDLPKPRSAQVFDADALNAQNHRDWDDDWDDDDIDTGDVIAGVAVLGAIAAIFATSHRQNQQQQRYPVPEHYPDDAGYRAPVPRDRYESGSISGAVDACVNEVERRGDRIGSVDSANRDGEGWYVSGNLEGGSMYWCRLDSTGRVSEVGGSGIGYADPADDQQYDDDYYARAREDQLSEQSQESYPGDDGRYQTAQAPDFEQ